MRKNNIYIYLFISIIVLTGCGGEKTSSLKAQTIIDDSFIGIEEDLNYYKIDIDLDAKEKKYTGIQKTRYKNDTGVELKEIYFRLYPNALKRLQGSISMKDISVDGELLNYTVEGEDDTVLRIELKELLQKDSKIEIDMEYFVKLPVSKERFGYGESTMRFGNWYPVLSVYGEDGWSTDPYYDIGDPFYTDLSNYDVSIKVEKDVIVATSGNIVEETIKGKEKIYKIEGKLIRDFAFVASSEFKVKEEVVDDTIVKLYYLKNNSDIEKISMNASVDSMKIFNKEFGKYPYGTYSVVLTEFWGGMEYPGLVYISKDYFDKNNKTALEQTIVHETAHQWWYGLVGNDEVKEAWLDEGLTSYSEVIYMDKIYGRDIGDEYFYNNFEAGYHIAKEYLKGADQRVNKPLDEFEGWGDYGPLVYTKAAMFVRDIEDEYGKEVLLNILSLYFEEYKYKIATTEDFLRVCERVTGESFDYLEEKWLN